MANDTPSFSSSRRWGVLLSVVVSILAVAALVVMANYLAARHPLRFFWSSQTRTKPSPQTAGLLKSITNEVKVTIYFDRNNEPLYSSICALLEEYRLLNPRISVERVDYVRDAGKAMKVVERYKLVAQDKDKVIFDCDGHAQAVSGEMLGNYKMELVEAGTGKQQEFRKTLTGFRGDRVFSSLLLKVTNPRSLMAYFVTGHGEHNPDATSDAGYSKFREVLQENWINSAPLNLLGASAVPADCNLLVIAGPQRALATAELQKIRDYLGNGGRLLALFHPLARSLNTGLEAVLEEWGVRVGNDVIVDLQNSADEHGTTLVVQDFAVSHPAVNALAGYRLVLVGPRPVGQIGNKSRGPEAARVDQLAFTGVTAKTNGQLVAAGVPIPILAAVEKGAVKGVYTKYGNTRMVIAGDSMFLENNLIGQEANRDFADSAVKWLVDQTQLVSGVGTQAMQDYKLVMTRAQLTTVRWIFLAGMPGVILLLGGLVWLRRRH